MTRILFSLAALVAALSPLAHAGITISSPEGGDKLTAGETLTVKWTEKAGDGPVIADLATYTLMLIVGGNDGAQQLQLGTPLVSAATFAAGNTASLLIQPGWSEDLKTANAYFIKMVAIAKKGGEYTVYSDRFAYSGMTGKDVLPANVKSAVTSISGTDGPAAVDQTGDKAPTATTGTVAQAMFAVEYTMQTGLTRYAPMQPVPPKKITATNTKPLFPTSSVVIAKSRLPIPSVQTTITASQTHTASSMENTVPAAPHATDDMAKFLRRWRD